MQSRTGARRIHMRTGPAPYMPLVRKGGSIPALFRSSPGEHTPRLCVTSCRGRRRRQPFYLLHGLYFVIFCVLYMLWTLLYHALGGVTCDGKWRPRPAYIEREGESESECGGGEDTHSALGFRVTHMPGLRVQEKVAFTGFSTGASPSSLLRLWSSSCWRRYPYCIALAGACSGCGASANHHLNRTVPSRTALRLFHTDAAPRINVILDPCVLRAQALPGGVKQE